MLRTALLLALWTVLLVTAPARAGSAPVLLVLGDSLSAAYGLERGQGWVELLRDRLQRQGYGYRVVNASISGETTRGGLTRLPALLGEEAPALVVLALGGNDGLRGIPLNETRRNLEGLVAAARGAGARVVLVGVRLPSNYGRRFVERFQAQFREVAEATGVALVPRILEGVGERPELFQADGLHPTAEAQPLLLDNLWPALQPLLE